MVNRVVPRDELEAEVLAIAERIATMPRFGLALTKKAVNQAEDLMGLHAGMDSVFGLHHLAHAHNAEVGADSPWPGRTPGRCATPAGGVRRQTRKRSRSGSHVSS